MGAWGYQVFEDDSALDAIDEFAQSEDCWGVMKKSLHQVMESAEIDYMDACAALAVGAILDQVLNDQEWIDAQDENRSWVDGLDGMKAKSLALLAAQSITRITHHENSELKDLWAETGEFSNWTTHLWGIHDRLMNVASTIAS